MYSWLGSSFFRLNTFLLQSLFTVTFLPMLFPNQFGPNIAFLVYNAHRAVTFVLFKDFHRSLLISHLSSIHCNSDLLQYSSESKKFKLFQSLKTINSFSYFIAYFQGFLLVCVCELAACDDFVRELSHDLPYHSLNNLSLTSRDFGSFT